MTVAQIAAVVAAYLIGSVSFARIVAARVIPDEDITTTAFDVPDSDETWTYHGVSATSVLQRAGARWGIAVIVLDILDLLDGCLGGFRELLADDNIGRNRDLAALGFRGFHQSLRFGNQVLFVE